MDDIINLIEQLQIMADEQAKIIDKYNIQNHKANQTLGENALVFHLKALKELVISKAAVVPTVAVFDTKTYQMSYGQYAPKVTEGKKYVVNCRCGQPPITDGPDSAISQQYVNYWGKD